MEKLGAYDFRAEGLSLERLLNQCAKEGIRLSKVRKRGARVVTGTVSAKDYPALLALSEQRGWRLTITRRRGFVRLSALFRRRSLLVLGGLCFCLLCWGLLSCVWTIDIKGAGAYTGEVERILLAHDIRAGRLGFMLNLDSLKADMEQQLTGLAWVGVKKEGVRLTVTCVQAQLGAAPKEEAGNLIAQRDGIIHSITVRAGTPKVKVGEAVRRGQVLVVGEERAFDGAVNPIQAEASVMARVWYAAEAIVSATWVETLKTGETYVQRTLRSPFYDYPLEAAPGFETYDAAVTALPIAGPFPIWLEVVRYEALTRQEKQRDEDEVREEAALAAFRLAKEKVPYGIAVIDKWVEYSMIKDGRIRATAVLEALEEIAVSGGVE